jgi:D-amino peptidase
MKVFISCDMEGVAGIVDWAQCRVDGGAAYERGCALLLGEVNAAVLGAVDGGVDEVVVNDSHGAMANLDLTALAEPATYLSGRHKPGYMMEGLDETFDAVFFVGYHGSISGPPSVLSHTYNPEVISGVRLGSDPGLAVGESGVNALVAHAFGVPIALVTGDDVTLAEAAPVAPDHIGVRVKTSVTRFAAHHLRPEDARARIQDGARRAVEGVREGRIAHHPLGRRPSPRRRPPDRRHGPGRRVVPGRGPHRHPHCPGLRRRRRARRARRLRRVRCPHLHHPPGRRPLTRPEGLP